MADSTLQAIENKVRRLTRSPSTAQLSQTDLEQYINTFVLYDFPEHLRLFNLKTTFNFYTNPGQDEYPTDKLSFGGATNNILYDFQNRFMTIHPPVYVAGYQVFFTQSREQFFNIYPILNSIALVTDGDGTSGPFTGVINSQQAIIPPSVTETINLIQSNVLFSAIGTPGTSEVEGMALVDVPVIDPGTGFKLNFGNLYNPNSAAYAAALINPPIAVDPTNNINYLTGVFTINFPMNTVVGTPINSQTVPAQTSRPLAVLYYNNKFTVRPVPDQPYKINFEVYAKPTELLSLSQSPELNEWWQYISYGSAKKVFEDRMDTDSVQQIMPEFIAQQDLIQRKAIVQQTNQRTATIYTEHLAGNMGNGWFSGGGTL